MNQPKVKICCISSSEEAFMAIDAGANVLGLVSEMPSGPGVITNHEIAIILKDLPSNIETFLLTSKMTAKGVLGQHECMSTSGIQLVDYIDIEELKILRNELPNVSLVQVIHVEDEQSINHVSARQDIVDYVLLDSGKPSAKVKLLGGTGEPHDWAISAHIVRECPKPVYLAGGLNALNILSAIQQVNPYGIDLCSGVRTGDKLDFDKLNMFMKAVSSIS